MLTALHNKGVTEPGEVEHWYLDIDQIRLVYEEVAIGNLKLVGWYRP